MRLLVVGGGGREHALTVALLRHDPQATVYCAPGNPGTAPIATNLPIPVDDIDRIADAVDMLGIDLIVIGPEVPLARGLADRLRAEGRSVFGPGRGGAQIESSKAFAKEVMQSAGVPTAAYAIFDDLHQATAYVDTHPEPLVVKASGLAAGKGAIVCETRAMARHALQKMLGDGAFGSAGATVVVESFLEGEELSVFALTNGTDVVLFPSAQDHKRLLEGDEGPNTGGMGAYSPVSIATPALLDRVTHEILLPTLGELSRRGAPFRGMLYAGLMIAPDGAPSVIEFNCRFGDPEAQVVLPLVKDGLIDALRAAADGKPLPPLHFTDESAVTTVLAAKGYPDAPIKGDVITLPERFPPGTELYHAGTTLDADGHLKTAGGRVLACTGRGPTFAEAQRASRALAEAVIFSGKQFRTDIGWRETARTSP